MNVQDLLFKALHAKWYSIATNLKHFQAGVIFHTVCGTLSAGSIQALKGILALVIYVANYSPLLLEGLGMTIVAYGSEEAHEYGSNRTELAL